jgi:hypothetical protein
VCTRWCIYDDGHAIELFAEDQNCLGESHAVPISLHDDMGHVDVLAWRYNRKRPDVVLNVAVELTDVAVRLTPAEARLLAESLLSVVETAARPSSNHPLTHPVSARHPAWVAGRTVFRRVSSAPHQPVNVTGGIPSI